MMIGELSCQGKSRNLGFTENGSKQCEKSNKSGVSSNYYFGPDVSEQYMGFIQLADTFRFYGN